MKKEKAYRMAAKSYRKRIENLMPVPTPIMQKGYKQKTYTIIERKI